MRLKNVSGAKEIIENSPYMILEPSKQKGNFQILFSNQNPIHVEIGMGKGDFIIENAKRNPKINYIGIEKFDSVIVRAIQKLEGIELSNLKLIRMDALNIEEVFDHEITTLYLNFSDPWPKKRHANRRLTSPIFLNKYDSIFSFENHIQMKTDNASLFCYSIKTVNNSGYKIEHLSFDLYQEEDLLKENVPTEYEKKFHEKGFPIYYMDIKK